MSEQERFDKKLLEIADEMGAEYLITRVPGVYEAASEHFNNDVLKALSDEDGVKKYIIVRLDTPVDVENVSETDGIVGIISEDNKHVTTYALWHEKAHNAKTIEVGERARADFHLSSTMSTYDVVRIQ